MSDSAECGSQSQYVANVLAQAQSKNLTAEQIARVTTDAIDTYQSYLSTSTGRPVGNLIDDRGR
jgi:hypothetical protein